MRVLEAYPGRVVRFELLYETAEGWQTAARGGPLGEEYECTFNPVTAQRFRLSIPEATEGPTLWEVQLGDETEPQP